jgi:hypothetical protein
VCYRFVCRFRDIEEILIFFGVFLLSIFGSGVWVFVDVSVSTYGRGECGESNARVLDGLCFRLAEIGL